MACLLQGQGQDRPGEPVPSSLALEAGPPHQRPIRVLYLAGDLDLTNRDQLRAAILSILAHRPQVLVLDLSELRYTDCSGLSVIVWAHHALASDRRQLCVAGSHGTVRRLMEITGIDKFLHLTDT